MCGIAGIVALAGPAATRDEIERMCAAMVHRGPDDAGYLMDGQVALGMRRLSIIDLAGGHQPIFNEDDSVAVIFNGEIYNFRELRAWLEKEGHRFRTHSDTEVIVHLWETVGIDFPQYLNGMFAIALYDRGRRRFVLARDHMGIKPLYYASGPDGVVFGSEVKVVLASGRIDRQLDVDALAQFLAWEYVPGAATLLRNIRRLEPGRSMEIELETGRTRIRRYWTAMNAASQPRLVRTDEEWEGAAADVIRRSVQRQLMSDVPLGAFLSGGVDSTLVVAAMDNPQTFSIGFQDASYDETRWAAQVADILGARHQVEIMRPPVVELFQKLMHFMDDPVADSSIFPTYLVSTLARSQVKVVMTGEGGDELFGGYDTFIAEQASAYWNRLPSWLTTGTIAPLVRACPPGGAKKGVLNQAKHFIEGVKRDPSWGHARWRVFCDEAMRSLLMTPAARQRLTTPVGAHILALRDEARNLSAREQALYIDVGSYLVDNGLAKIDRMTMACSLEARVPLLDREVVEFAFGLPPDLKYDGRRRKILLKRLAERHVPRRIARRRKEGFSAPVKHWLRNELRSVAEHYLDPARLSRAGLLDGAIVGRLWQEHLDGRANHSHLLWSILIFEEWRERWMVEP